MGPWRPWFMSVENHGKNIYFDIFHRNYSIYHISSYNNKKSMQQLKKFHV